jgi:putative transposase
MEVDFCLEAIEEALARYGKPTIFNSPCEGGGQGSQFTGTAFTGLLRKVSVAATPRSA